MVSQAKLVNKIFFWVTQEQIDEWFHQTDVFFILAHGRSGTAFLADLLSKASNAYIVHEPVFDDYKAFRATYNDEQEGMEYFRLFRKKEIYLRARSKNKSIYGEVNSILRRHIPAIKTLIPHVTILHLVRDGRDVVRSMWSRKTMTFADPVTRWIRPSIDDPYFEEWETMDQFAKLCWYWQSENAYIRELVDHSVQFERLIRDFAYFQQHITEPLSLKLTKSEWEGAVKIPKNVTRNHKLPSWRKWNRLQKDTFLRICAEEMRASGYQDIEGWDKETHLNS